MFLSFCSSVLTCYIHISYSFYLIHNHADVLCIVVNGEGCGGIRFQVISSIIPSVEPHIIGSHQSLMALTLVVTAHSGNGPIVLHLFRLFHLTSTSWNEVRILLDLSLIAMHA